VHILSGNQLDGPLEWFFTQATWAYNQIICFLEVFLGISSEQVNARLATEVIFFIVIAVRNRLIFADA
jgi:hypothetical protein